MLIRHYVSMICLFETQLSFGSQTFIETRYEWKQSRICNEKMHRWFAAICTDTLERNSLCHKLAINWLNKRYSLTLIIGKPPYLNKGCSNRITHSAPLIHEYIKEWAVLFHCCVEPLIMTLDQGQNQGFYNTCRPEGWKIPSQCQ